MARSSTANRHWTSASTPDWDAFLDQKAAKDAPNVLVILYDDTGCAAWSTYGGRINMPTLDRLASQGLTYSQWHTTSVCSPTRSTLLTGRNHHQNGFGTIAESAAGFGYAGPFLLRTRQSRRCPRRGWSTFWVGKNHNVPSMLRHRRQSQALAAGPGLRPVLRLHRRRNQPVVSGAHRRQSLRRAALPARGRLPLLQRHRRQGN